MKQFIDKLISEFEKMKKMNYEQYENADCNNDRIACISASNAYGDSVKITKRIAEEYKPRTNADKVRTMTDSELAVRFAFCPVTSGEEDCMHSGDDVHCFDCILDWLQSEVKDGD